MKFLSKIFKQHAIDLSVRVLFCASVLLHGALWVLLGQFSFFNSSAIFAGLVIIFVNFTLIFFYNSREPLIGYILGGTAFLVQSLLLILLFKSSFLI